MKEPKRTCGCSGDTCRKVKTSLELALVLITLVVLFILIWPLDAVRKARETLGPLDFLSNSELNLFKSFWLEQIFQILDLVLVFSVIFLILGMFISWNACHRRKEPCKECIPNIIFQKKCQPPSALDDPTHTLRPILVLYIVFILASCIFQIVLGVFLNSRSASQLENVWNENSAIGLTRRTKIINSVSCCGWTEIFEYQLAPECTRSQLLRRPPTCKDKIDTIINDHLKHVGNSAIVTGVLELFPWIIIVVLRFFDERVQYESW